MCRCASRGPGPAPSGPRRSRSRRGRAGRGVEASYTQSAGRGHTRGARSDRRRQHALSVDWKRGKKK